jgi:YidC/Oxa1 family membrane protein insertase
VDLFARSFVRLLAFYYSFTHDYAVAILLLTLTVMVAVLPLTLKATRSTIIMQKVAPELKKLQDKHKNDRQKLNEEMMAFYKENKINPLSGCFPILLQAPIFFFLYQALHGITDRNDAGVSTPKLLDHGSDLYKDIIAANGEMVSLGMDFAKKALEKHPSFWAALPFFALIIVMVAAQYWQQRQMSSRTPTLDNPQAQTMKQVMRIMPPLFGAFALTVPAGLVLYWAFSSVLRVVQFWAMYRFDPHLKHSLQHAKEDADAHLRGPVNSKKSRQAKTLPAAPADKPRDKPAKTTPKSNNKSKRKGR